MSVLKLSLMAMILTAMPVLSFAGSDDDAAAEISPARDPFQLPEQAKAMGIAEELNSLTPASGGDPEKISEY